VGAGIEAELLVCPDCGAAVATRDEAEPICAVCGARVALPDAHAGAKAARDAHAGLSAEASDLADRIGGAPSPALQVLTLFEGGCATYLLLPFLLIGGFFLARRALYELGPLLGRDLVGDERFLVTSAFGFTVALFGVGLLGATYAGRQLSGLRELQAGLAAKLPERAGGHAACRLCGAELEIAPGARAARCRYCGAENLVAIAPSWLRRAKRATQTLGKQLQDATRAHEAEALRLRASFARRALFVSLFGATFLVVTGALVFSTPPSAKETREERLHRESDVPRFILERAFVGQGSDVELSPLLSRIPCSDPMRSIVETFRFAPVACKAGVESCMAPWFVALRAGDVVHLETDRDPRGLVLFFPQNDEPPFTKAGRGELITKGYVSPGNPLNLLAPRDGWYLVLYSIDGASPDERYDLCAELARE
jgi:DNA-directed RNA polymerase subunit RPC12/RpoP